MRSSSVLVSHLVFILLFASSSFFAPLQAGAEGEVLSIAAVGDIMMGTTFPGEDLPPNDGIGMFDGVKGFLKGNDIVLGNLEGPLIDGGRAAKCRPERRGKGTCFEFRMPTRYALHLTRAGFTTLNIANNHSHDFGEEGHRSTVETLLAADLSPVGNERISRALIKGRKVAVAGFSFCSPAPFSVCDIDEAKKIVEALKREGYLVVVSFHAGAEGKGALHVKDRSEIFLGEDRGNPVRFARSVIDAGADLVVGHGPHVLRAVELYRGRLIAYSLGNFLTYGAFNIRGPSGLSAVLLANLDSGTGEFLSGMLVPVRLENRGIPVVDESNESIELLRELTARDGRLENLSLPESGELLPLEPKKEETTPAVLTIPSP